MGRYTIKKQSAVTVLSVLLLVNFVGHVFSDLADTEEPQAPLIDCPRKVTLGDSVTCHCKPNPAAPGRPRATVGWRDLRPGAPLLIRKINASHIPLVYQCQLRWGNLKMSLNHTFQIDPGQGQKKSEDIKYYIRCLIRLLAAAACAVSYINAYELIPASQRNVEVLLFLTRDIIYGLLLLNFLPDIVQMVLKLALWVLWKILSSVLYWPHCIVCSLVGLVPPFCGMVVAVLVFVWQCLCCVFWLVPILVALLLGVCLIKFNRLGRRVIAPDVTASVPLPSSSKQDPKRDFGAGPPSYWQVCQGKRPKGQKNCSKKYQRATISRRVELSPDDPESQAVAHMMYRAWTDDHMYLFHTYIQVLSVERIENVRVWDNYNQKRKKMAQSSSNSQILPNSPVTPLTSHVLPHRLNTRVNEHYLFHGTKEETLFEITRDGLDMRYARNGLLGRGLYFAESSTKSDWYTDRSSDGSQVMLLARVLLGNAYVSHDMIPPKYVRPPCRRCQQPKCLCPESAHYDSVISDVSGVLREFVIYDSSQCYPEYVVRYKRCHVLPPWATWANGCYV